MIYRNEIYNKQKWKVGFTLKNEEFEPSQHGVVLETSHWLLYILQMQTTGSYWVTSIKEPTRWRTTCFPIYPGLSFVWFIARTFLHFSGSSHTAFLLVDFGHWMRHVRTTPKHQCPMVQIMLRSSKRQIWEEKATNSVVILWHGWISILYHIISLILRKFDRYFVTYIHTFTVYYDSDVEFTLPCQWQLSILKTSAGGIWRSIKLSTYGHQWPKWMNHLITVNWKSRKPQEYSTCMAHEYQKLFPRHLLVLWSHLGQTTSKTQMDEALLRSNMFKKPPANLGLRGKNPSTKKYKGYDSNQGNWIMESSVNHGEFTEKSATRKKQKNKTAMVQPTVKNSGKSNFILNIM